MPDNHVEFHSKNGKRQILIAEDEEINRMLLSSILEDQYDLLFAENGRDALSLLRKNQETLSLVLLDLMMPVMSGTEFLRAVRVEPDLARIPVIVFTADREAEIESLELGAIDFIPKPYPRPGVVLARILRTIELSEDRQILDATERDPLTGLYNREFFFSYAVQYDHHHQETAMDAIVIDVNHFHMMNERYGKDRCDAILRRISGLVREMVRESGGIVCRREADTFLVYCPHREDYEEILNAASEGLSIEGASSGSRVRLRMGVYANADKTVDIERRFDRAQLAADTIRNNFNKKIAIYDRMLHETELYAEQLTDDFEAAVSGRQFKVFYQPKFDIRGDDPVLSSAEALVRWEHPSLGMISPGVFIPLFEQNGMIRRLDAYVWRETARQISEWKRRLGFSVPVSVNISRVDMFDEGLVQNLLSLLREFSLHTEDLLLEITESAYTDDSDFIMSTVRDLREKGFRIEMDDFGTGYSSLAMISHIPIDALKMDMMFVRNAFGEKRDTRMLELIMGIADHLGVPVIAEGVETTEQTRALHEMGCDLAQGYHFSRPVSAEEFEPFLARRLSQNVPFSSVWENRKDKRLSARMEERISFANLAEALAADYFSIYCVDLYTDHFIEFTPNLDCDRLDTEKGGDQFFLHVRKNIRRIIAPEDLDAFLAQFTKEKLIAELDESGTFIMNFRLLFDGIPTHVSMKAVRVRSDDHHIVIGVNNVDAYVRRLQELERANEAANRDPLTGVKSRYAFSSEEKKMDARIAEGNADPFGLVLCDINGLKEINDTLGHSAGDGLIRAASSVICTIFTHSPVYRIGGDEFVVLIRGQDYENRGLLLQKLGEHNAAQPGDGVIIAFGMAEYRPGEDDSLSAVFSRADAGMYGEKKRLKERLKEGLKDT